MIAGARVALPIMGSLMGLSTIAGVYILTNRAGHFPPGASTPPISLLGCNSPEHLYYQVGFVLTGLILLAAIDQWRRSSFYDHIHRSFGSFSAKIMLLGGYLAVVGVIGQGIVTLEENFLLHIKEGRGMSFQSILHQQLAGVFFLGAAMHCYATAYYILSTTRSWRNSFGRIKLQNIIASEGVSCCYRVWSVRLKLLCVITSFLAVPIAEGMHPTRTHRLEKRNLNIAGMAQYIAVASYIIFFGSYSLDFASTSERGVAPAEESQMSTRIRKGPKSS